MAKSGGGLEDGARGQVEGDYEGGTSATSIFKERGREHALLRAIAKP